MEEWKNGRRKPIEETIEKLSGAILIIIPPFHNSNIPMFYPPNV